MMSSTYALISELTNEVINTIIAESTYTCDGCYIIQVKDGLLCQEAMFYNKKDMHFYYDAAFTQAGN